MEYIILFAVVVVSVILAFRSHNNFQRKIQQLELIRRDMEGITEGLKNLEFSDTDVKSKFSYDIDFEVYRYGDIAQELSGWHGSQRIAVQMTHNHARYTSHLAYPLQ